MKKIRRGLIMLLAFLVVCLPAAGLAAEQKITVYFTLLGDTAHGEGAHSGGYPVWIDGYAAEVAEGTTAAELAAKVLTENGYMAEGIESGYITSVTSPEGVTLMEYTNGPCSGWLYMVDAEAPTVGMGDYLLKPGEHVYLYYTDDYNTEYELPAETEGPPGQAEETVFTDLSSAHWAYPFIMDLAERQVIGGYADGSFGPEDPVTRAEFVTMLARMNAEAPQGAATGFSDVPAEAWYADHVAWGVENGIVSGVDAEHFEPDTPVSRQDICAMIWRCAQRMGLKFAGNAEASAFADQEEIADYAAEAVDVLCRAGIVSGREDNCFMPADTATRAETAKMLSLAFGG